MKPNLLRDERKRRGWSQAQVAEVLGTTTKTVARWELGQTVPFPCHRDKLFALFGKTVQELGLVEDVDEKNDAFKQSVLPLVQSSVLDTSVQPSFLADPTIPLHLKSDDTVRRRNGFLILVRESLFAADTVLLTGLAGLPSMGNPPPALALVTDRRVQTHFRGGILWAELGFRPNVLGVLARWGLLLGITPNRVEDLNSRESWSRALRAAIGTRQMLLVINNAGRAEDALALQIGSTACTYLLTTHLPEVALVFAQQGAIIVSQLDGADRIAFLQGGMSRLVERRQ